MLIKTAYKTYTKLKKMGKFSKDNFMKALKDSGIEEIVDIAGDLFTIVDPASSWIDVTKAIIDVTTGLETNNKGNKAAEEAMDKASDLVKGSKKADLDKTFDRVKPRKSTKEKVTENQPKNEKGELLDPNDGSVLDPNDMDLGHKPGHEFYKYKSDPANKGKTRKEVIEDQNKPEIYQWENRSNNRSHKYEQKSKGA